MEVAMITALTERPAGLVLATQPSTARLLEGMQPSPTAFDVCAVGLALHLFTEPIRRFGNVDIRVLHRATTVLSKALIRTLRTEPFPLQSVGEIVTDPARRALLGSQTVAELLSDGWPGVRELAAERVRLTIEGASDYGVQPMLRLAATRALQPGLPWWGTPDWEPRVRAYARREQLGRRRRQMLNETPEHADDAELGALISNIR